MPAYLKKSRSEITSQAIQKVLHNTEITSTGPGSIVRAIIEAVASELGDMYSIFDYNVNQTLVTTATGSALDKLGLIFNTIRKPVNELAKIDKQLGAFMFYIQNPHSQNILIPKGVNVYTDTTTYIGQRFAYSTTEDVVLTVGSTRVYVTISPNFSDTVYTAGINSLIIHDAPAPVGVQLFCTNPKEIAPLNNKETDEQFRNRIIKAIRLTTAGTADAVRYAGLQVDGVRDVKVRQAPYGMGSFEAIIVPERNTNSVNIINRAIAEMEAVRPIGSKMIPSSPILLSLDLEVGIIAPMVFNSESREIVIRRATVAVSRFLNILLPGSELVYNQLILTIMDSSDLVKDVNVKKMAIGGREVMRRNYRPAENEQVVIGNVNINLISAAG